MQKNAWARPACPIDIGGGSLKSTVIPPSIPWATTAPSAMIDSAFTHGRVSFIQIHTTSAIVSMPTVLARSRWPCS